MQPQPQLGPEIRTTGVLDQGFPPRPVAAVGTQGKTQVVGPSADACRTPPGEPLFQLAPELLHRGIAKRDEDSFAQIEGQAGDLCKLLENRDEDFSRGKQVLGHQANIVCISPTQVAWKELLLPAKQQVPAECEEQRRQGAALPNARPDAEPVVVVPSSGNTAAIAQV